MLQDIKKLEAEVIAVEKELDRNIDNGEEYDKIYQQSIVTDRVLARYMETKKELEQERKNIVKNYDDMLNTSFRNEVTGQIMDEVKKDFPNVDKHELYRFSDNVYIYSTLKVKNVNEQDIIDQLIFLNNRYFDFIEEKGAVHKSHIESNNLEYLKKLHEKYQKIIKEKIG